MAATANLVEVFSSIQGEGIHVGASTVFVRFGRCDLRCRWCDSPHTWKPADAGSVTELDGSEHPFENPVPVDTVLAWLERFELEQHRFVSFTGGEPLLQSKAVAALAAGLRGRGPRRFLETHGLAREGLAEVLPEIDVVSMDWKLASEVRREGASHRDAREAFHATHAAFLREALGSAEAVVKVVVTPATENAELDAMLEAVVGVDASVPVILQPVTPTGPVRAAPRPDQVLAWHRRLERGGLRDVRSIPQTHKTIGLA
ncbi:MAG: 7-carboxy-7-deazaguanine synthase QueE [Myxococcota bacterium]